MAKAKKTTETKTTGTPDAKSAAAAKPTKSGNRAATKSLSTDAPSTKKKTTKSIAEKIVDFAATSPALEPSRKISSSKQNGKSTGASIATAEQFRAIEQDKRELPLDYGETKIVLMSRDPEWIFTYWEINAESRKKFGLVRGKHEKALTVRFYEVQDSRVVDYTDITVNDFTSSWYFKIPNSLASYRAEIGVLENADFRVIASSNSIAIPRHGIAEESSAEFAEINDEVYTQIVQLSGGYHIGERLGGDDFLKTLQQKVFQSLTGGPLSSGSLGSSGMLGGSSFFSGAGFSGDLLAGPGIGGEASLKRPSRPGEFWLEVGVDVIVYGATMPDATVRLMGQDIRLTPDGTFRVRMVLPDASIEFPVEATSADGSQKRTVKPIVNRTTAGDPHKPI